MTHVLMNITVEDYDKWREVFDSMSETRAAASSDHGHILRHADDPSRVTILGHYKDGEKMMAYLQSPALREAMLSAGVLGGPEIVPLASEEKYYD